MKRSSEEILLKAIQYYGKDSRIEKSIEEMAELMVALKHYKDGKCSELNVKEEICDVTIMMTQLCMLLDFNDFNERMDEKIELLNERMGGE